MSIEKSSDPGVRYFTTDELQMELDIVVESKIEVINSTVSKLMRILKKTCCGSYQEFAVQTGLREAMANAIIHGNRLDPAKKVRVRCGCNESCDVVIIVKDEGEGFDPASIPSPLTGTFLNSDHGRGLYLISAMMDDVRIEEHGTEIHMRKKASGPCAGGGAPTIRRTRKSIRVAKEAAGNEK